MAINVSSIIGNIESALKAASVKGGDDSTQEPRIPRLISPTFEKKDNPEMSFRGKTLFGRMYVDGKGSPFRSINWLTTFFCPYLSETGDRWFSRTIRTMAASNYVGMKEDEIKLNRELQNAIKDFEKKGFIPEYKKGQKYVPGTPIITTNREVVLFYFKPQSILVNGVASKVPQLGAGSFICAEKSGLLSRMLECIQTENSMNEEGWIDGALGRDGINKMNVLINGNLNSTGKGYEWSFGFKSSRGVELTQEDLDASLDLNNEYISNIFDAEKAEQDLMFIREQTKIREESALKNFDTVENVAVESSSMDKFEPVKKDADVQSDDIPF